MQVDRSPSFHLAPVLLLLFATAGQAETAISRGKVAVNPGQSHLTKASSHLLRAREAALEGMSPAALSAAEPSLRLRDGRPEVEIKLSTVTPELVEALAGAGLEVDSSHPEYGLVYGRLDPTRLAAITALPEVRVVRQKPRAGRRSAYNQADRVMNGDDVRSSPGANGNGVTIGILSDSFQSGGLNGGSVSAGSCACSTPGSTCTTVATGMTNQTLNDLPASVAILDDCTAGAPNCSSLSDEGAALGENIFDVAPGANQMFHSAFNSPADFASGITELVNCGADIIVDDVFWTNQPFFQDGVIAAAAQDAVDAGVHFFSAAGNDATFGIQDFYSDSDPIDNMKMVPDGKDFHDFGAGDRFAEITVPAGCDLFSNLQWAEPFGGAVTDMDLYLLDTATDPESVMPSSNILASSTTRQGCGTVPVTPNGDPDESLAYNNTGSSANTVFLAIDQYCSPSPETSPELRIINISFNCSSTSQFWDFEDGETGESSIFVDPQIFGHPAAKGVNAVGAIFFIEMEGAPGFLPGQIDGPSNEFNVEAFSSKGGDLPFYFDKNGTPLPSVEMRHKPEIVAPDGGDTTFFGSDFNPDSVEPGDDPNFFGTSSSAPNAAAVAALLEEITNKNLTPKAMKELLKQTAVDVETPGMDDLSGHGSVDALKSAGGVDDTLPSPVSLLLELDEDSLLASPSTPQDLLAASSLTVGNGNFDGANGISDLIVFINGFISGANSTWGPPPP